MASSQALRWRLGRGNLNIPRDSRSLIFKNQTHQIQNKASLTIPKSKLCWSLPNRRAPELLSGARLRTETEQLQGSNRLEKSPTLIKDCIVCKTVTVVSSTVSDQGSRIVLGRTKGKSRCWSWSSRRTQTGRKSRLLCSQLSLASQRARSTNGLGTRRKSFNLPRIAIR